MDDIKRYLKKINDKELISLYGAWHDELKERGIIRTRNIVGEVGEYFAIDAYLKHPDFPDIYPAPVSMKHFDALSRNAIRYTIKTVTSTSTGVFYGLNPPESTEDDEHLFDYLILVKLNKDYTLAGIYEMNWNTFLDLKSWHSRMGAWKMAVNKYTLSKCVRIDTEIEW